MLFVSLVNILSNNLKSNNRENQRAEEKHTPERGRLVKHEDA